MKDMPSALVAPLVIATVFGVFALAGVAGGCIGGLSVATQGTYPMPPGMADSFALVMERTRWVTFGSIGVALLFALPTGVLLLGGALATVMRKAVGQRMLAFGFAWAVLSELVGFAWGIAAQVLVLGPTMELLDNVLTLPSNTGQPLPPGFEHLGTFVMAITAIAVLASLVWIAVKVLAYLWARRQVQREEVSEWYAALEG
ncbi:MAG: hypothetical protein EP330_02520 [Deltaproteobacteria bacterium]|nr:MAG: hypothetical protein EP330_02520 [Deltaproteobacteria bacterium]